MTTQLNLNSTIPDVKVAAGNSTVAVHAGAERPNAYHSLTAPVVQTATYTFADTQDLSDFMDARMWGAAKGRTEYGRYGNPTVTAAEAKLAALEGAQAAVLYSSGMAAVTSTLLTLVQAGSHVVITDDSYRRTRQFCLNFLKSWRGLHRSAHGRLCRPGSRHPARDQSRHFRITYQPLSACARFGAGG